ncbi:cytosolic thiouridylase subunit Ctu1 [Mitosporidium daphniae]
MQCVRCTSARAIIRRSLSGEAVCKGCFFYLFEEEIHQTITSSSLFQPGDKVAIAVSGGKDSTVLAHVLTTLNKRYNYNLDLLLLSIDEGISGYRDDSLETVKVNQIEYGLPLKIITYEELYEGWTMDKIVARIGNKNNCTFCGVFRRQALDRGAVLIGASTIVTGHNADDMAETVLLNLLRGDVPRLARCTSIRTCSDPKDSTSECDGEKSTWTVPRSKPFKYTFEKEIVMYAYHKKLTYFSTECKYAPNAYRGHARTFLKQLERMNPRIILNIIRSGESFAKLAVCALGDPSAPVQRMILTAILD